MAKRRKVRAGLSLVIASLAAGLLFAGCRRSGSSTTVAKVCQEQNGAFVTVEGFLQLPNFLEAEIDPGTEITTYDLVLVAEPDGHSPAVKTSVPGTRSNKENHIADLPSDGYTRRDLRIFTASGEMAGSSDRVRLSGTLSRERDGGGTSCVVKTERIERLEQ